MSVLCALRIYNSICKFTKWVFGPPPSKAFISYYILSDYYDDDDTDVMERVPEGSIFIEQWELNGVTRCNLFYEGETIVRKERDPFTEEPEVPWIWIGDTQTEVDLTFAMEKYMAVGNRIELDLLLHLIQVHHDTQIMYMDARTLTMTKFPAKGVEISAKTNVRTHSHTD